MSTVTPSSRELGDLIRASSSPLTAMSMILSAYPETMRESLAAELHSLCHDVLLRESLAIYEKEKQRDGAQ